MSYVIQAPAVSVAVLTPNPVQQSGVFTISVTITEAAVTLEPYHYFAGDIFSGEV